MSWGLDTSFILRLLVGTPRDQYAKAAEWMAKSMERGDRPKVTDFVIAEAYFALQTHYGVPKGEALNALWQLLESGDVEPAGFALEVMRGTPNLANAKPGFVDRLIHAELGGRGAKMLTFEKSASKLSGAKVL